jgi:O-antigen ligase/polysaccharide polymerase Wzy-like membrane protein
VKTSTRTTGAAELKAVAASLRDADVVTPLVGVLLTFAFAYEASRHGGTLSLGFILAVGVFAGFVYAFLVVPHIAVAATIPIFAFLPATKVLVAPWLGPTKDVIALAAIVAGVPLLAFRHRLGSTRPIDLPLVSAAALLIAIYVINAGGGHNVAWAQGVRLACEPLLLLLAGLGLEHPRRTLRWGITSLIVTAAAVALTGLIQQALGPARLVGYGYSYDLQVRTISGHFRSFGTLDDPFAYAAFVLLGLAALLLTRKRDAFALAVGGLLLVGIAVSYVRTAALIAVALLALYLARQRRITTSVALLLAVVATAVVVVVHAQGTEAQTYRTPSATLTLNGRTSAWKAAFGTPTQWFLGQGVGAVGTAASRARYSISETVAQAKENRTRAVDSGYFATVADVGVVGLIVLLALLGRAATLAARAARRGDQAGWVALGLLTVMLIDALTRASFTGFPSAFLGMLLLGIALAAAAERPPAAAASS